MLPAPLRDVVNRARLRADTQEWLLARMAPKRYGDKVQHVAGSEDDGPGDDQHFTIWA